ncbi:MAG: hypothetical protein GPJ54_04005 [Candidatus Heimdallarchaeota archaeon]|nr:hypothetical protein [Candidatus Heimdallarchaeota archaeon]
MKVIVFVVSSFGLGHLMRQMALIQEVIRQREDIRIKLVCSEFQIKIAQTFDGISERVEFFEMPFVPFMTMDDPYHVDVSSTIDSYQKSWDFETQMRDDTEWGRILFRADLIVNDIDSLHNPIAKKMGIPMVNISNFTWSDILKGMGADELANNYTSWERLADVHLRLPFASECMGFDNYEDTGILSREVDNKFVSSMKTFYPDKKFIFLNRIGEVLEENMDELVDQLKGRNYVPILPNSYISMLKQPSKIVGYKETTNNTHDMIAASVIMIGKTGYSSVAECFVGATYFIHWAREGSIEDDDLSEHITKNDFGEKISHKISVEEIMVIIENLDKTLEKTPLEAWVNSTPQIAERVLSII